MFLRTPVVPRAGRLFKVGRTGLVGKQPPPARGTATLGPDVDTSKLGHVARRRIASPPMVKIERAVEAVGSALQAWSDRFIAAVMREVVSPVVPVQDSNILRADASVEQVYASLDDPKVAKATLESTFRAVDKASSDDLRVVGVRTGSVVPNADRLQSEWIDRNVSLIKAQRDVVSRVRKVIEEAIPQGKSVADIRKMLEEQAGYARSRAELTARDQTLKLYGQIQQERQQAAGFTHYVWTTSLDERVREEHAELDGKVIAWDDPPVVDKRTGRRAHAGMDFQCRCSAVPFTGDDVGEAEAPALETEPEVTFTARLPEQPDLQARAAEAAQARIAQAVPVLPPASEPFTATQLVARAQVAPKSAAKLAQVERAVDTAVAGRSLEQLRAIPFTAEEMASDAALQFLRADPLFRATGNVADNFGSSKGGLPQITIEADGTAYLSNGRHRLTVARELGLRQIIARVRHIGPRGAVRWEYVGPIRV